MNAFDDARTIEARSLLLLRPFLEETHGGFVMTNKGRLAKFLQATAGDILLNSQDGRLWSIELKAEQRWTGNLFLETWSNRNLADPDNHANVGSKIGWLFSTRAELLFYHFLDTDKLVICNMFALKGWAFCKSGKHMSETTQSGERCALPGRVYDFTEVAQKKYQQLNDTRGRIVPLSVLNAELKPKPKLLSVRQLRLDLLDEAA